MTLTKLYNTDEVRDLLLPLLDLEEAKDYDTEHWLEGGEIRSEDLEYEVFSYSLGLCSGDGLYSSDDFSQMCSDAYHYLKLDQIISDFDMDSEQLWFLCPNWQTNLRISEEALKELYYTRDSAKRLDILERVIEACEQLEMPFIDRWAVKLTREALKLGAQEALRCL